MDYLFKLRFLSKPLVGRELLLREGEFSIGSGDCDVWIPGSSEDHAIVFDIGADGVCLKQKTSLWCKGVARSIEVGETLPLQDDLDIDGVQFVLGEPESELSAVALTPRQNPAQAQPVKSKLTTIAFSVLMAASVVLLSGVGYLIENAQADNATTLSFADVQKKIIEFDRQRVMPGVKFNWQNDGVVEVSGECKKEIQLQPVLDFLKANKVNYVLDVVCNDRLVQNVLDVLQLNGFDRVFVYMDNAPGKVVISGQIEEDARWKQVVNLLNDMHGLRSWSVKSTNDKELEALIDALRSSELLSMLSIQRIDDRIVVSGHLSAQNRDVLNEIFRTHMRKFPGTQEIVYQNISTNASAMGILPAPVASVGGNSDFPYVILEDGSRLQKGAVLPGGYQIVNIDGENGIELSKRGELLHLPLGL
ncbi:type III secretion system inner membrane ring subunit SctD [Citrobacter sp. ANG330]|uniref:type III secretion system inner membrane ring subunit SctD n=1 Tax=Citrobacter sp. ANG330 TaxID=3048142 RepID=UPI0039C423BB